MVRYVLERKDCKMNADKEIADTLEQNIAKVQGVDLLARSDRVNTNILVAYGGDESSLKNKLEFQKSTDSELNCRVNLIHYHIESKSDGQYLFSNNLKDMGLTKDDVDAFEKVIGETGDVQLTSRDDELVSADFLVTYDGDLDTLKEAVQLPESYLAHGDSKFKLLAKKSGV